MAGLTDAGLVVRTQAEIQELLEQRLAQAMPGVNLRAGPLQQIVGVLSEELAICWEALAGLYANGYPDGATGLFLKQLCALTGTVPREATKSRVTETLNIEDGVTIPAGSIIAVDSNPDAQFQTTVAVSNSSGVPADVDVVCEALVAGPVLAPAGTLQTIVTSVVGWNSATNVLDAEEGLDEAADPEIRDQRQVELAGSGSDHYEAIRAGVARVDGVLEVHVYGNETLSTDVDGRPGKSFEAVVWDGDPTGAEDDEIAQAIWDEHPAGILPHGVGDSGTATDDADVDHTVDFTRATALRVYVETTVILKPNTGAGWEAQAKAAIAARGDGYSVGDEGYASHLTAVLQAVPSIEAVVTMKLEAGDATPDDALVATDYNEIIRISSGDVTITEA